MGWTDYLLVVALFLVVCAYMGYRAIGPERVQELLGGKKLKEWFDARFGWLKSAFSREKTPRVTKLPEGALEKQLEEDAKKNKAGDSSKAAAKSLKRFLGR